MDLEFGFDLNPELLQQSSSSIYEQQQPPAMSAHQMPPARSPINIVDAAIVSFSEAGGPMMIPVAPFGMFPANGGMPPPFTSSSPYLPFPIMHQVRTSQLFLPYGTSSSGHPVYCDPRVGFETSGFDKTPTGVRIKLFSEISLNLLKIARVRVFLADPGSHISDLTDSEHCFSPVGGPVIYACIK